MKTYTVTVDHWSTDWYNEDGKLHRTDGPAVERRSGYKAWLINGLRHRTDGPAIEYSDGEVEYYFMDAKLTKEQWETCVQNIKDNLEFFRDIFPPSQS